jgi:dihydropteroate synthase
VPVSEQEELRRVVPIIDELAGQISVPISIDTMKPEVARRAIQAGASIVNDVAANRTHLSMWQIVAQTGAAYVCVHMQGSPQTMQSNPVYSDVVREVREFFIDRMARLKEAGVRSEQIILDPGIGFGKTAEHNLQLLRGLCTFADLGRPSLLGASRKSFITKLLGSHSNARLTGSLACVCLAIEAGVQIIRAHDVAETVQTIRMTEAILPKRQ